MAEVSWFIRRGDKQIGPVTPAQLKAWAASGRLKSTDRVRSSNRSEWISPHQVKGLLPSETPTDHGPVDGDVNEVSLVVAGSPPLPPVMNGPSQPMKSCGYATASLVLGILSVFFSCLTGLPGLILGIVGSGRIKRSVAEGVPLAGRGRALSGIVLSVVGSLVLPLILGALLMPVINASRSTARRSACSNNLKQIMLAMHNYHDTRGHWPPNALCDADGRPLLSWRVALLPYLEESALYEEFHLDEPWDSPHNRQLIEAMPACFACPSRQGENPGITSYVGAVGPGYLFRPADDCTPTTMRENSDGTSRTIACLEVPAAMGVEWTRPDAPLPALERLLSPEGQVHGSGILVACADGSVRVLTADGLTVEMLEAALTIAGGEAVTAF